jgi:hypothetical protein
LFEGRELNGAQNDVILADARPDRDVTQDEIIARRVQPMAGHVEEVVDSKYFKPPMTVVEVGQALADEKRANPQRIPYFLRCVPWCTGTKRGAGVIGRCTQCCGMFGYRQRAHAIDCPTALNRNRPGG